MAAKERDGSAPALSTRPLPLHRPETVASRAVESYRGHFLKPERASGWQAAPLPTAGGSKAAFHNAHVAGRTRALTSLNPAGTQRRCESTSGATEDSWEENICRFWEHRGWFFGTTVMPDSARRTPHTC